MAEQMVMPQLGESVTEGTLSKWLVKAGDRVQKYDPICEISTDKVVAEVPSTLSGTITEIIVQEGETVPVGSLICYIASEGEELSSSAQQVVQAAVPSASDSASVLDGAKQRFSPAVLKLAQDHSIDLSMVQGTGAGGRITRSDILDIVEGRRQFVTASVQEAEASIRVSEPSVRIPAQSDDTAPKLPAKSFKASQFEVSQEDQIIPVSAVRKTIANRMVQSKHEAPHAWMMIPCDVTNLVQYRNKIKDDFKKREGINLTYMPFFIKAVVEAIKEFPMMNSQWAGDHIIVKKAIHISIAVATDDALFVPVIKDADQKNILGLAKTVDYLAKKSREGKLTMDDMTGGTFTVNNTGSFGSVLSAPIINQPQAAILSVEAIQKQPVVIHNMIAIRDMMNICLSLDHRILDGLVCGRFLQSVKQKIESYGADTRIY
ncbi:dihydrolipoamide acetyltransferase family protein [Paenibacillus sediminis]|uniref:Dihydrolipoamide acetyltransferase component of pyruvate dehydrogenase complex n=1 Tax=Paenibacillus sediminis TaxID=664909 RepID=A0ABS4H6A0_9BACL|nr:dihydrolipoamide acetyltransferase family protein [Paenibacillus sediminis]MBP1937600.1 2-oxoisovalerate dehydrogenase E2 component (dihydrolipoyl transacylase) [Paenibacillus sediminis]